MTFRELTDHIKAERRDNYATLLLSHADTIIHEVGKTNKTNTAKELGMSPQTFSLVYQLILAHTAIIEA